MNTAKMLRAGMLAVLLWLAAALLPILLFSNYHLFQLTMVVVYAIAILGLVVLTGYNGQISLGHGAFYAIGAYVTAILMDQYDWPYWATLPASAIVCAAVGFLIGLPALRLGGLYLALTTFALAVAVPQLLKHNALEPWTGGVQGLVIDKPDPPFGLPISHPTMAVSVLAGRRRAAVSVCVEPGARTYRPSDDGDPRPCTGSGGDGHQHRFAEDADLRAQRDVHRHRRIAWRNRGAVRRARQLRYFCLDLFLCRPGGRRRRRRSAARSSADCSSSSCRTLPRQCRRRPPAPSTA